MRGAALARRTSVPDLAEERKTRHHERAISDKLATLPEPMARQILAWVGVMRGQGRRRHAPVDYRRIRGNLNSVLPLLQQWAAEGRDLRQILAEDARKELRQVNGSRARELHHVLSSLFAALKQERITFHNPMARISLTTAVRLPVPLPSDRVCGILDELDGPRGRLAVGLVAIHGLRPSEIPRLILDDLDLAKATLRVRRPGYRHTVYLDALTIELINAWLAERYRRWPRSPNPHLFISNQSSQHPGRPPMDSRTLRGDFQQTGLLPKQLWADRVLDEARHTADPVHLVRVFGIHPHTAVRYVSVAHPDKALPKIR